MLIETTSNIDRKSASKLLRVSVRTIDRYIRRGFLRAHTYNGRIWLNKKEITRFIRNDKEFVPITVVKSRPPAMSTQRTARNEELHDAAFYRDLYNEAHRVIAEYRQKLDQSNYRLGQLESQMLHQATTHLPTERMRDQSISTELLSKDLRDREKEIELLKTALKSERAGRIIFAVITYALLLLQPIFWYLLRK